MNNVLIQFHRIYHAIKILLICIPISSIQQAKCHKTNRLAAIKIIKIEHQEDFESIELEIRMMKGKFLKILKIRIFSFNFYLFFRKSKGCVHPNIVEFYGSYIRRDKLYICMEFCG